MSLIVSLLVALVVLVLVMAIISYLPVDARVRQILQLVVAVCVVIWLLTRFVPGLDT